MKNLRYILLLAAFGVGLAPLPAQQPAASPDETETNWLGIHYRVVFFKRIPPERLLVGVRVFATPKATPGGTLIGFPVSIPPNANKYDVAAGYYHPRPLNLASSVMVEDATQQNYPVLPPVAPPGRSYRPGLALDFLKPGESDILTIQFAIPPPPPPPPAGQPPVKQTVSFLFPNAKGSIKKIPLPPPDPATPQ